MTTALRFLLHRLASGRHPACASTHQCISLLPQDAFASPCKLIARMPFAAATPRFLKLDYIQLQDPPVERTKAN
jgi:hypothetical protein